MNNLTNDPPEWCHEIVPTWLNYSWDSIGRVEVTRTPPMVCHAHPDFNVGWMGNSDPVETPTDYDEIKLNKYIDKDGKRFFLESCSECHTVFYGYSNIQNDIEHLPHFKNLVFASGGNI